MLYAAWLADNAAQKDTAAPAPAANVFEYPLSPFSVQYSVHFFFSYVYIFFFFFCFLPFHTFSVLIHMAGEDSVVNFVIGIFVSLGEFSSLSLRLNGIGLLTYTTILYYFLKPPRFWTHLVSIY